LREENASQKDEIAAKTRDVRLRLKIYSAIASAGAVG
jgi:hypothetical protein